MLHSPRSAGRGASRPLPDRAFYVACAAVTGAALLARQPIGATALAVVSTALIVAHEMGHMVAARLAGIQVRLHRTVITPFYGRSSIVRGTDTWGYVAMALAGPVTGAAAAAVGWLVSARLDSPISHWVRLGCTAALVDNLLVNLLPVSHLLDGAKAVTCVQRMLRRRAARRPSVAHLVPRPEIDVPARGDSAAQIPDARVLQSRAPAAAVKGVVMIGMLLIGTVFGLVTSGCGARPITAPRPYSLPPGVSIGFTSVPARGSSAPLRGLVAVSPVDSFRVSCYIHVAGQWWTKPYWSEPVTVIAPDHSFAVDITTGGVDEEADEILAYLIAVGFDPPLAPQEGLPDSAAAGVIGVARAVR